MKLKAVAGIVLTALLVGGGKTLAFNVQPAAAVDWWPMFHHDLSHTGYSTSTAPNTNNVLWKFKTKGQVWSSPAVVGGRVFVGSMDGNVYCLNESTGALIWKYETVGAVWSSPAVADGKVFIGSPGGIPPPLVEGFVYCFGPPGPGPPPTTPTLTAEQITENSITLSWSTNQDPDFARYEVYQSSTSGVLGTLITTITSRETTTYKATNLSPDTAYYFTVRVYNTLGLYADSTQLSLRTKALPFYAQPWFLATIAGLAVVIIATAVVLMRRKGPSHAAPPPPTPP